MSHSLQTPFGTFTLQRRPHNAALQAWDAADEYLVSAASEHLSTVTTAHASRVLVINDSFGALACALHSHAPVSWGDSHVAHLAMQQNWQHNALPGACTPLPSTAAPEGSFGLVLWRVPKSRSLFAQQIARLRGALRDDSVVLVGGMDKHLLPDTRQLLEQLGRVDTLPGRKKSHLFRLSPDNRLPAVAEPNRPIVHIPELNLELQGDANLFSQEQIDIGARFFIEQFAQLPPAQRVADLGCGNGVLMLVLARQRPDAELHGFDESYQAVACAQANWQHNIGGQTHAYFHVADGLRDSEPFELILCNPPFHQQHVVGDHVARQLFAQSQLQLAVGGKLWVVGNRHLAYREMLRERFGNCVQVAENKKFVVLRAVRRH